MSTSCTVTVKICDENGVELTPEEAAKRLLKDVKDFEPYVVYTDCPYAAFVEFGTMPAKGGTSQRGRPSMSDDDGQDSLLARLREWADRKGFKDREAHDVAWFVYRRILTEGMAPMPFFRPAIFDVQSEMEAEGAGNKTVRDIAERVRDRMRLYLSAQGNDQNTTWMLSDSLDFKPASEVPLPEDDGSIPDRVWRNPEIGRHDDRRPPDRWRRMRWRCRATRSGS